MDYASMLTNEQKKAILNQRIAQFAAEAYQHTLNKTTCEALGDLDGVTNAEKSLEILSSAISVHTDELNNLPTEE